ncbi:MAG: hypothetical protein ACOC45_04315 [Alkalispirochaetaceae bacterium]
MATNPGLTLSAVASALRQGAYPRELTFSRARDYHLYTADGRRYLDCILAGGSAPLGHNPPGLTQAIKNRLTAGPAAPLAKNGGYGKLRQAVRRLFPAVSRVTPVSLSAALEELPADMPVWRPFAAELPPGAPEPPAPAFLISPLLPLADELLLYCETAPLDPRDTAAAAGAPGPNPAGVAAEGLTAAASAAAAAAIAGREPEATPVSPVVIAGLTKAVHLVATACEGGVLPRKLSSAETDAWREPMEEAGMWRREGIYYSWAGADRQYHRLREELEEAGILIPPDNGVAMVMPRIVTAHERSLWKRIHSTL